MRTSIIFRNTPRITSRSTALLLAIPTIIIYVLLTASSAMADTSGSLSSNKATSSLPQTHNSLAGLDWLVIAMYFLGMIAVGWYYARKIQTTKDYLLGGRTMPSWAIGLSMFATLLSTISYLSYPGEVIRYGPMILCGIAAYPLIFLVVGYFIIPFIMKMKVTSAYEILELRFGLSIRMLGVFIFLSLRLLWMATVVYVSASTVLIPILGWDEGWTPIVCAALGLITVAYTSLGGFRAVIFTDVVQTFILFGGAVLALILITISLGGVDAWWPEQWLTHWPEPVWGLDASKRISFGGMMIASFTWYVCTSSSDQMVIQRYLATRDAKSARHVLLVSLTADAIVTGLLVLVGLAILAYYASKTSVTVGNPMLITEADKLFPQYIVSGLPIGLSGMVIAGLLAAAMSSLSSGMNSSCSVITVDLIDRFRKTKLTEQTHIRLAKWVSIFVGAVVVLLSLYVSLVPGNIIELAYKVVNLLVAPLFLLFFMAMFVPWATTFGTWCSAVAGTIVAMIIAYWEVLGDMNGFQQVICFLETSIGFDNISFLWIMPSSLLAGIIVGCLASLFPVGSKQNPRHI